MTRFMLFKRKSNFFIIYNKIQYKVYMIFHLRERKRQQQIVEFYVYKFLHYYKISHFDHFFFVSNIFAALDICKRTREWGGGN